MAVMTGWKKPKYPTMKPVNTHADWHNHIKFKVPQVRHHRPPNLYFFLEGMIRKDEGMLYR